MILAKLAKKWSSGLWRLFRPTELLQGLVDAYRVSANKLTEVYELLHPSELPVGIGQGYEVITVPLANIGKNNVPVAGVDSLPSEKFPFMIVGLPSGILYFCRSQKSVGASAFYTFLEHDGVYFFKEDPTKFGVISTREGLTCSFLTFNGKAKALGLQDLDGRFFGSTNHFANLMISEHDSSSGISNGIDPRLARAAAGVADTQDTEMIRCWKEGNCLFGVTSSGELARTPMELESGCGRVGFTADGIAEYYKDADAVLDTTYGPDDPGAQRAIHARINLVPSEILHQTFQLTPPADATGIYVFHSSTPSRRKTPAVCAGTAPRHAVLDSVPEYGVSRILFNADNGTAINLNGVDYGQPLTCGRYIKAISFIKAGKELPDDAILSHIQVAPVLVHAGGCVVFLLN